MKHLITLLLLFTATYLCAQQLQVSTITEEIDASGGVKLGPDGHLYIGNFGEALSTPDGNQVWRLNLETFELEVYATGLQGASGNDFDSQGNLFQSNIAGGYISKITPEGEVSTFVSQGISAPVGIAIDKQDNLFVCNCDGAFANTIRKVTPEGVSTEFSNSNLLSCPNGITIDKNDNLYITNFNNSRLIKITPQGEASIFAFIQGNNNGHLTYFEPCDALFVNSHGSSSVYKINLGDGIVNRIAGTGQRSNIDGPADMATFSRPNGIALSTTGDTLFLNSSIPTQDNPNTNYYPLNPSVIRMITGVSEICSVVNTEEQYTGWNARLYPTVSSGVVTLSMELPRKDNIQIQIFDVQGKAVYEKQLGRLPAGPHTQAIRLNDSLSGQFYLLISGEQTMRTLPFQIVK